MATGTYEWQSDFARKYVGQGREEGRAQGLAEGREEGREEGLEAGLAKGKREDILRLLEAHGVPVDTSARRRIEECTDLEQLDTWFGRAIKAETTDELFV